MLLTVFYLSLPRLSQLQIVHIQITNLYTSYTTYCVYSSLILYICIPVYR